MLECLQRHGLRTAVLLLGLPDRFIDQGDPGVQLAAAGLDEEGIERAIRARLAG